MPAFEHGVASGDPAPDSVVLWTRVNAAAGAAVPLRWTVAADPDLTDVVVAGEAAATPGSDHTVHVAVPGLRPATTYWYGFTAGDARSPVGRTRTLPAAGAGGAGGHLRLGVVCCSHYGCGRFNAYGRLAERDVDVVVHLGDYIYEAETRHGPGVRQQRPKGRCLTLVDYRARHAQYKTDPDLQALHARHPMVAVWDDHELAGNAWWDGAAGHEPRNDGPWANRRAAAVRAYWEWMPSLPVDPADPFRAWRTVPLGPQAELFLLDTRLWGRQRPASGSRPVIGLRRRDRALLGPAQWEWLEKGLDGSACGGGAAGAPHRPWALVASQVMAAPVHLVAARGRLGRGLGAVGGGLVVNPGQWDGYPVERERLLALLARRPGEALILSGDLHSSWVSELRSDDGAGSPVVAEFSVPAVSAPSFARALAPRLPGGRSALERVIRRANPHVSWVDTAGHGYLLVDVTSDRIEGQWWHVERTGARDRGEHLAATWSVHRGDARPRRA